MPPTFEQQLRTVQAIIGALALGPLFLAGVILLAIPGEPGEELLTRFGLIGGFLCLVAQQFVSRAIRSQTHAPEQRMSIYTTSTIVSAAVLEGGAFFNLIIYLLERSNWSLAMAGLLWVALLLKMPTQRGVEAWLEREERRRRDQAAWGEGR